MKSKAIIMGLLAFFLICVESTVLHRIEIYGIVPNLSLCMVVSCSLLFGSTFGRRLGILVGLCQDILFLDILGFYTLLYFLLGQAAGVFKNGFDQNSLLLFYAFFPGKNRRLLFPHTHDPARAMLYAHCIHSRVFLGALGRRTFRSNVRKTSTSGF